MINSVALALIYAVLAMTTPARAQVAEPRNPLLPQDFEQSSRPNTLSSRPNPSGGLSFSDGTNGVDCRPNPSGGYSCSNGVNCRPNPIGGMDCSR